LNCESSRKRFLNLESLEGSPLRRRIELDDSRSRLVLESSSVLVLVDERSRSGPGRLSDPTEEGGFSSEVHLRLKFGELIRGHCKKKANARESE